MAALEELKKYFDDKFASLASARTARCVQNVNMKRAGNQMQADYLIKILNLIIVSEDGLQRGDYESVKENLGIARKEAEKRLKLVKLADKSDFGWETVKEYASDDLASDSDDDRRIRKAENAASAKRKKRQQEFNSRKERRTEESPNYNPRFFRERKSKTFNQTDICFTCGKSGHWARNCTEGATKRE